MLYDPEGPYDPLTYESPEAGFTGDALAKYHAVNDAVTLRLVLIVTLQDPDPLQSPDHEEKVYPVDADAVTETLLFVE